MPQLTDHPSDLHKTMLTVNIGIPLNRETFIVHKELLCLRSNFFRRAAQDNWIEAKTDTVDFLEDVPDVFMVFENWLYTHGIDYKLCDMSSAEFLLLVCILGDKHEAPQF